MKQVVTTGMFLARHPLARRDLPAAFGRYLRWKLISRLIPGDVIVPFVGTARLCVRAGMTGATGNIFAGLHEFEEMAFTLHLLRPEDLFLDIGANVGTYTVLAAKVCGARVLAFEPVSSACNDLLMNVRINGVEELVDVRRQAISSRNGMIRFTATLDATNHVVHEHDRGIPTVEVEAITLDSLRVGSRSRLCKIDVEGHEGEVLDGGEQLLRDEKTLAVILELTIDAFNYGRSPERNHEHMLAFGFRPFRYDAFARRLVAIDSWNRTDRNTIYARDPKLLHARLASAPVQMVAGVSF